jgi:hypothetical protein
MVFAFGSQAESGLFAFIQNEKGHVYTWPNVETAKSFFTEVVVSCHIYQVDPDLSIARLIEKGKNDLAAPQMVALTEEQKAALYKSYVYKSLLAWAPIPGTVSV